MKTFYVIRDAQRSMPGGLRLVTTMCLILSALLPAAILPVGEYRVNGIPASFAEFWRCGAGIIVALVGLLFVVLAYGFIRARPWARHLAVLACWSLVGVAVFDGPGLTLDVVVAFFGFGCLPSWYFYFRRPVKEYFGIGRLRSP